MAHEMTQIKSTANEHMRRDLASGGKWVCSCEACTGIRSLMGMDKMLDVRPLVRQIQGLEEQLKGLADSPEKQSLMDEYFKLHDELAETVAK